MSIPPPIDRRTHGVYRSPDEAMHAGRNLVALFNGIPVGYSMGVFERFGLFPLISYPKGQSDEG